MEPINQLKKADDAMTAHSHHLRPLPRPLGFISWIVIASQLWCPYASCLLAATQAVLPARSRSVAQAEPAQSGSQESYPINRTAPRVTPAATTPVFSDPPTDQELFRARVLGLRLGVKSKH